MKKILRVLLSLSLCVLMFAGFSVGSFATNAKDEATPEIFVDPGKNVSLYVGQTIDVTVSTNCNGRLSISIFENGTCEVDAFYGTDTCVFHITGLKPGTMQFPVSVTSNGQTVSETILVTVVDPPVLPAADITVIMNYKDVDQLNTPNAASWLSTNTRVATIDTYTGKITAVGKGKSVVAAFNSDGEVITTFNVEVHYSFWQMLIRIFLFGWIWY